MPHGINGSNDQKHSLIDETCGCTTEKNLVIMPENISIISHYVAYFNIA